MEGINQLVKFAGVSKWPLAVAGAFVMVLMLGFYVSVDGAERSGSERKYSGSALEENQALVESRLSKIDELVASAGEQAEEAEETPRVQPADSGLSEAESYEAYLKLVNEDRVPLRDAPAEEEAEPEPAAEEVQPARPAARSAAAGMSREEFDKILGAPTRVSLGGQQSAAATAAAAGRHASERHGAGREGSSAAGGHSGGHGSFLPVSASSREAGSHGGYQNLSEYSVLKNDDFELKNRAVALKNPYCVRQGSVIPAVLLSGINSELPGMISAQVTRDVLDSPTGTHVLIPSGTRIVGQYGSNAKYGQERLFLAFNRLIFPNGASLNLGAMPGQSSDGYSGFDADVDNHFWKLISGAVLLAAVSTAVSVSDSPTYDSDGRITVRSAASEALSNNLGSVLSKMIERNLNLAPTLSVEPGYVFSIAVSKDIYFDAPYES